MAGQNIAFYVSAHGFGHAAREQAVIGALARRGARVFVRSAAPGKFFTAAVDHHKEAYDVGLIQDDPMSADVRASFQWYADFLARQDDVIAREVAFVRDQGIRLIAADMPPVAFEIAEAAGVPSAAVTHFTWDWVYDYHRDAYPEYGYVIDAIRASYGKATLALQMPFAHPFPMFPHVEPIPLVINPVTKTRADIWREESIPADHKLALLSMGGIGWGTTDVSALRRLEGWMFLTGMGAWEQLQNLPNCQRIPDDFRGFSNLIAAADVMIGKLGWSTVAEVIGHRTPFLYTMRDDYRENDLLRPAMDTYGHGRFVPNVAFAAGAWADQLDDLAAEPFDWPEIRVDGADVAAERLLAMME